MAYTVIATRYRPRRFDELVGQEYVAKTLTNAIRSGRVAHAFLFIGVRGVGKTSAARILAKSLNCTGRSEDDPNPCGDCAGSGRTRKEKTLSVTIPRGVEDGTRIRLTGEGEAGLQGASAGDLYIFISIQPHRLFQRDSANVFCQVPIPMTTAALGGSVIGLGADEGG